MSRKPSRSSLSAALGVSKSEVSKRVSRGMPESTLAEAAEWSAANVRRKFDPTKQPADQHVAGEYSAARVREAHARAAMSELRLAQARGELVDKAGVERAAHAVGRQLNRTLVEVWPPKVSVDLAAMSDPWEIECFLREQMRAELTAVAMTPAQPPDIDGADRG